MPPDYSGGRDGHVRDVTAPFFQNRSSAVYVNFAHSTSPLTPDSSPPTSNGLGAAKASMKPAHSLSIYPAHPHSAPLLTPRSSSESLHLATLATRHTPTLVDVVFPGGPKDVEAVHQLSTQLPRGLTGAILDRLDGRRSVYIHGLTSALDSGEQVKDVVVQVLDLADEAIEADEVVFVLEKEHPKLRQLLQGLLYVGGVVVKNLQSETNANPDLVLVGIEI